MVQGLEIRGDCLNSPPPPPPPLARYCTHQETTSGHLNRSYLPSDQNWNGLGRGRYSSRIRINVGSKNAATIQVIPGPFLKSGLGSLARYGTHQETISEQKYLPSDPRSECPAEGPLFKPACFRNFQIAYPDK